MKLIYKFLLLSMLISTTACNDWVTDLSDTNDKVYEDQMNTKANIDFMVVGLHNRLSGPAEEVYLLADGLSDAMFFDQRAGASTYASYRELDIADNVQYDNSDTQGNFSAQHLMRMNADTLVGRCLYKIEFNNTAEDIALRNKGLFWGYFYGALARYHLGAYFGLDKNDGGSPINGSPMISSNDLFDQAVTRWTLALAYSPSAYMTKVVRSLMGRTLVLRGNYTLAVTNLNLGLVSGDAPYNINFTINQRCLYLEMAGTRRLQWCVDNRYAAYIAADPAETARIRIVQRTGTGGFLYWEQTKYTENLSTQVQAPFTLINWQEVDLLKAECTLNAAAAGDPTTLVNGVRASHGIAPLAGVVDIAVLSVEREKELFLQGQRLLDQRRFNQPHVTNMWLYLPISLEEIRKNDNITQP